MPTYEYTCPSCGPFERAVEMSDRNAQMCDCGEGARRRFGMPAVKLRGTGWYQTTYGNLDKQQAQGRRLEREKKIRPGHDLTRHESA